jgi:hypothetical protein
MKTSNLIELFERDLRVKNYAESSIRNYVSQIRMFLKTFGKKDSPSIDFESITKQEAGW